VATELICPPPGSKDGVLLLIPAKGADLSLLGSKVLRLRAGYTIRLAAVRRVYTLSLEMFEHRP
jgi:hypothetical protein